VTTGTVVLTLGRALVRSRLIAPPRPAALLAVVREAVRGRTNPFTLLAVAAARWPSREALVDEDGVLTYRELRLQTESLAHELICRGCGPGQSVGVLCRNGRGFAKAVFAAALVGGDVILLNTDFGQEALTDALNRHAIATVIVDSEFAEQVRAAGAAIAVIDAATTERRHRHPRPKVASPGRIVLLTSGTTGQPKGVPRKPRIGSALGIGATILARTQLRVGSRIAIPVPMFHGLGFGMLVLTVGLGGTVLTARRFDAEATLVQASRYRADAFIAVPVVLARILDLPDSIRAHNPLRSLRVVISSGARLDPALAQRFTEAYGETLYNGYGTSEAGIGAIATPAELRDAPETVGRPVVGCPVRILDDRDRPVGPEVIGRIFVGGDLTFEGYTGGGGKSVVAGMTDTGDMGYFDEAGRLFVVGRGDDMIVSGGENVYPRAVENALAEHPDIADNAVIGVPDQEYGERLAAFVVPQPGTEVDTAAISAFLKDRVSRFEQPREVTIVAQIPRNPAGKVLRNELHS
jgi:acyl-CoA synthetase (AMP-forming)/AMP-acid ligase II